MTCGARFFTMLDAMLYAIASGSVVYHPRCAACGWWHVRRARSQAERERCVAYYQDYIKRVVPGIAKARGIAA